MASAQEAARLLLVSATDRITLNVGGRLFETTTTTLESSGSHFFQALLGRTGATLAGSGVGAAGGGGDGKRGGVCSSTGSSSSRRSATTTSINHNKNDTAQLPATLKRARTEEQVEEEEPSAGSRPLEQQQKQRSIYIDRDPEIFEDVLYFMRCNKIRARTRLEVTRLDELSTEAEYFACDALLAACGRSVAALERAVTRRLESEKTSAEARSVVVEEDGDFTIEVEDGKVVYIVSATLAGRCRVKRYTGYPKPPDEEKDVPGCYVATCEEDDTGDFQLFATFDYSNEAVCIAHVGLDHMHVGKRPVNYDFRQDLRLCLAPSRDDEVVLSSMGSGDWHVVYWVGDADAIPQLADRCSHHSNKRRKVEAMMKLARKDDYEEEEEAEVSSILLLGALLLAGSTSLFGAAAFLG